MLSTEEEKKIFALGYKSVAGIDEAGRGPLAGPVVAACLIYPAGLDINWQDLDTVNDSKKLNAKKRAELFPVIKNKFEVGIGICDQATIDKINILEASFLAMKIAIGAIKQKPDFILLDGKFPLPNTSIRQKAIIRGDSLVFSIAAASIIAKVTRDKIMDEYNERYPEYRFDLHKGYGTKLHLEKLREYGPCPIHRRSFAPVKYIRSNPS